MCNYTGNKLKGLMTVWIKLIWYVTLFCILQTSSAICKHLDMYSRINRNLNRNVGFLNVFKVILICFTITQHLTRLLLDKFSFEMWCIIKLPLLICLCLFIKVYDSHPMAVEWRHLLVWSHTSLDNSHKIDWSFHLFSGPADVSKDV